MRVIACWDVLTVTHSHCISPQNLKINQYHNEEVKSKFTHLIAKRKAKTLEIEIKLKLRAYINI